MVLIPATYSMLKFLISIIAIQVNLFASFKYLEKSHYFRLNIQFISYVSIWYHIILSLSYLKSIKMPIGKKQDTIVLRLLGK